MEGQRESYQQKLQPMRKEPSTLFLPVNFTCTQKLGKITPSHSYVCYLAFGILSSRPPRGIPHPPELGASHTPQLQCRAARPSHTDTDYSTLSPASLTRPTQTPTHARGLKAHIPRGPAQTVLTGWGSSRGAQRKEAKRPPAAPRPGFNPTAVGDSPRLPYTSREFCCFSSRTMSTTVTRKDLSLV